MAIQQTKKQPDLEKRLKLLHQQVYGYQASKLSSNEAIKQKISIANHTSDITYLHRDLLKISLLASLALGTQIILFYLLQNNFLKINLF